MKPTNKNVLLDRERYIGGSEIPTIMNINPFQTRFDLMLIKAQLKDDDFEGNVYTRFGQTIEPIIRDFINSEYNYTLKEETTIKTHSKVGLRANHDGLDKDKSVNCEIKSTSMIKKTLKGYRNYLVQTLYGSDLADAENNILVVYHRTKEDLEQFELDGTIDFKKEQLQVFEFKTSDHLQEIKNINKAVDRFIFELEILKENPFITEKELKKCM